MSANKGMTDGDIFENQSKQYKGTGVLEVDVNNNSYIAMRTVSEDTGWSHVIVMHPTQFFKSVNSMRNIVLIIISSLVLAGVILAFILSRNNYKPIKALIAYIKNNESQQVHYESKNELEMIRFSFERNYKKNRELMFQNHYTLL